MVAKAAEAPSFEVSAVNMLSLFMATPLLHTPEGYCFIVFSIRINLNQNVIHITLETAIILL